MRKSTLVIAEAGEQIPLDFRDTVTQVSDPTDVRFAVARFRQTVDEKFHSAQDEEKKSSFLGGISFGSKVAENEFRDLHEYYVATDQSERTLRGEVNLVVGRKGSGKSALFFRVKDQLQRHRRFVSVALQPEGYQLQKLKERVLRYLEPGSQLQLLTAFWHYLLLSEIAITTVEQDTPLIGRNGALQGEFEACVAALEASTNWNEQADFSERLSELSERLIAGFTNVNSDGMADVKATLSSGQIIQLVYGSEIRRLQECLGKYLAHKDRTFLLFDNIDKGWSSGGVSEEDLAIVSSLIEAARKIERELQRKGCTFHSAIFLRSDVLDLLIRALPDRGKDSNVSVDWHDISLLKEVFRKRLNFSMNSTLV